MRRLLLLAAAATAFGTAAPEAQAARECEGLQVCVPVAGPWVVVPSGTRTPRPSVRFQLTCPQGYVVAGLDAELSHRAVDVTWAALLGTPGLTGVSTQRSAVFTAVFTGRGARGVTFRPHIGCIPTAGGGGRIPTSLAQAFPPGPPAVRRVRTTRVRPARTTVLTQRCAPGERLVDAWHAVGFRGLRPPSAAVVESVRATRAVRAGRIAVTARATAALGSRIAVVQAGLTCGGGP